MYIIILPVKRQKNILIFKMEQKFKDLVDGYNQANSDAVKNLIYQAMVNYTSEYHPGYICYDMDMYVELYKCATTPEQRKHALDEMYSIIIEDSYQFYDEIVQNFKEVACLTPFLKKNDIVEFDILCMTVLDYFKKELKWSEDQPKSVQFGIPDAESCLKIVAGLIVGTNMSSLETYREAKKILGK